MPLLTVIFTVLHMSDDFVSGIEMFVIFLSFHQCFLMHVLCKILFNHRMYFKISGCKNLLISGITEYIYQMYPPTPTPIHMSVIQMLKFV